MQCDLRQVGKVLAQFDHLHAASGLVREELQALQGGPVGLVLQQALHDVLVYLTQKEFSVPNMIATSNF